MSKKEIDDLHIFKNCLLMHYTQKSGTVINENFDDGSQIVPVKCIGFLFTTEEGMLE